MRLVKYQLLQLMKDILSNQFKKFLI